MSFHAKSLKKIETLQKRALHVVYDDYNSLSEKILKKSGKFSMEANRLMYLYIKIYENNNVVVQAF